MKQRILVEGADFHLLVQICMNTGIEGLPKGFETKADFEKDFLITSKQVGKREVVKEISPTVKSSGITHLGIVVDADTSAQNTKSGLLNLEHDLARRFSGWFSKTFQF